MRYPTPWYIEEMSIEDFILGMLNLGKPVEVSIVGAFEDATTKGRGSQRDIELPLHKDGDYSAKLAGPDATKPKVDVVGLYCIRTGKEPCFTTLGHADAGVETEVNLEKGQALILDNNAMLHGRRGPVGERILMRFWVTKGE